MDGFFTTYPTENGSNGARLKIQRALGNATSSLLRFLIIKKQLFTDY